MPDDPNPQPGDASRGRHPTRRRARRWLLRSAVLGGLALLLVVTFIARSGVITPFVEPRLERALQCEVALRSAVITPTGGVSLRGVRIDLPNVAGPAATVLTARRVDAAIGWRGLLSGAPRVRTLTLHQPTVRLSQSRVDGRINVQNFPIPARGAAPAALPSIRVVQGVVEFAEHDAASFATLFRLPIAGEATVRADARSVYDVRLQGAPEAGPRRNAQPSVLEGSFDTATNTGGLTLSNVDLAAWGDQWAPSRFRDQWNALRIEGRVDRAALTIEADGDASAELTLSGVAMSLPVAASDLDGPAPLQTGAPPGTPRLMRMRDVSGTVRFTRDGVTSTVKGLIEDLRYRVVLATEGLALDAPFRMTAETVEPFTVERYPTLLPFAPAIVRRRFATFSGPTAVIDAAEVRVTRGAPTPDGPARPNIEGAIRFRDGTARYENFPYPITKMGGLIRFDDERIDIESIVGVGPTGASLHATGHIAPPTDGAAVDIRVNLVNVSLDRTLQESMPAGRGDALGAMLDLDAYDRLRALGLFQSSAERTAVDALLLEARAAAAREPGNAVHAERVADLERARSRPVFDLGGLAEIDVHVQRALGPASQWSNRTEVRIPTAGLLVRAFPYPAVADDVVVRIDDTHAVADIRSVRGITGAVGRLDARIALVSPTGERTFQPDIVIHADRVPFDDLLIEALPRDNPGGDPDALSARRALRALNVRGEASCRAAVAVRPSGRTGFDVGIAFTGLTASPGAGPDEPPALTDLEGEVVVREDRFRIERLDGLLAQPGSALAPHARIHIDADAHFAPGDDDAPAQRGASVIAATLRARQLDLGADLERLARPLSPDAADQIADLRGRFRPAGALDVAVRLTSPPTPDADGPRIAIAAADARDLAFDALGGRVRLASSTGSVAYERGVADFRGFSAPVEFDGEPSGTIALHGFASTDPASAAGSRLRARWVDARFESRLVARALAAAQTQAAAPAPGALDLAGAFDADAMIVAAPGQPASVAGAVQPRSLAFTRNGARIVLPALSGRVTFDGPRGSIIGLTAAAPAPGQPGAPLGASVDGSWSIDPALDLDLTISADAARLDDDLRAALPDAVRSALDALEVRVDGPVRVQDARLRVRRDAPDDQPDVDFDGRIGFRGASLDVGAPITQADGAVHVSARAPAGAPPTIDLRLEADALRAAGLRLTDAAARIRSTDHPGHYRIDEAQASSHGGRVSLSADVQTSPGAPARYDAAVRAWGVAFGPALADFADTPAPADADPRARGELDASLSIAGGAGQQRVGRGFVRVAGGEVLRIPTLTRMIELSNLRIPLGDRLNDARADFFLLDDLVTFERLTVASAAVEIVGRGAMTFPELGLDLRLNSRSTTPIPLLSGLLEGMRDELATIVVRGTLRQPDVGVEQLSGARRLLGSIFGPGDRPAAAAATPDPQRASSGVSPDRSSN